MKIKCDNKHAVVLKHICTFFDTPPSGGKADPPPLDCMTTQAEAGKTVQLPSSATLSLYRYHSLSPYLSLKMGLWSPESLCKKFSYLQNTMLEGPHRETTQLHILLQPQPPTI